MIPPHDHIAITIDGGGIRGLIIAQALKTLERELGVRRLIHDPRVQILSGTSTGALISGGIALGLSATEITDLYLSAATQVFPPIVPGWVPDRLAGWIKIGLQLIKPSLYSSQPQIDLLRKVIGERTGNPELTLGGLNQRLGPGQCIILTSVDITERRTHFLKSYDPADADIPLWQAILSSAVAPTYLPVVKKDGHYLTDGGLGSFGNPAYVAGREAVEWQGYPPASVSVFSFGTGWLDPASFERIKGAPDGWKLLDWAQNAPFAILDDAIRAQSVDLLNLYGSDFDLRRYQLPFTEEIALDATSQPDLDKLKALGDALGERISNDQHALGSDPNFDPEGIRKALVKRAASIQRAHENPP